MTFYDNHRGTLQFVRGAAFSVGATALHWAGKLRRWAGPRLRHAAAGLAHYLLNLRHKRTARLAMGVVLCCLALVAANAGYVYRPFGDDSGAVPAAASDSRRADSRVQTPGRAGETRRLLDERRRLEAALRQKVPGGTYIVIDQTHNRLYVKRRERTLLEAVCSGGSGMVLRESGGGKRVWLFDTPRGAFKVTYKTENPVWKKPDWAFVEEGLPIPSNPSERFEYGVLGKYALSFGNGYMIHGTLYERLLGRSVTHGCIRLGADDLWKVYWQCPVGTPIYIY